MAKCEAALRVGAPGSKGRTKGDDNKCRYGKKDEYGKKGKGANILEETAGDLKSAGAMCT